MGADLLLSWVWTTRPDEIDFEKARSLILEELTNVPFEDGVFPQGVLERWDPHEDVVYDGSDSEPEDLLKQLLADVDEVEAIWGGENYRDSFVADLGPVRALLTGGMSWGDSPTDTFDVLNRFGNTPAAKAAGFFDWEKPGE